MKTIAQKNVKFLCVLVLFATLFDADAEEELAKPVVINRKSGMWTFQIKKAIPLDNSNQLHDVLVYTCTASSATPSATSSLRIKELNKADPFENRDSIQSDFDFAQGKLPAGTAHYYADNRDRFMRFFVSHYLEIDIDFKGGTWEQLAESLSASLSRAYATQVPDILKPILPKKLEFEIDNDLKLTPRFDEIQLTNTILGAGVFKSNFDRDPDPEVDVDYDYRKYAKLELTLSTLREQTWSTEFFNLAELPQKKGEPKTVPAADLAALFEISWKSVSPIVWARTRYHSETGMLIVQGTIAETTLARAAFNALSGKISNPSPFDKLAEKLEEVKDAVTSLNADNRKEKEEREAKKNK